MCRSRGTPIITFINKMDREVREPLDLIDEIERTLGMSAVPFSWPIGMGKTFHGVYDLAEDRIRVFRPGDDRLGQDDEVVHGLDNPAIQDRFGQELVRARGDIELVKQLIHGHTRKVARYRCDTCGFKARQFQWRCPACGGWETYPPRRTEEFDLTP